MLGFVLSPPHDEDTMASLPAAYSASVAAAPRCPPCACKRPPPHLPMPSARAVIKLMRPSPSPSPHCSSPRPLNLHPRHNPQPRSQPSLSPLPTPLPAPQRQRSQPSQTPPCPPPACDLPTTHLRPPSPRQCRALALAVVSACLLLSPDRPAHHPPATPSTTLPAFLL